MLLSEEVEIELQPRNIKHLELLGYEIPRYYNKNKKQFFLIKGSKILVKVKDLSHGSNVPVEYLCDYCLDNGIKTVITSEYNVYLRNKNKGKSGKDCCKKCSPIKQQENFQLEYGVSHQMHLEEIKYKVSKKLKKSYEKLFQDFSDRNYTLITTKEEWEKLNVKYVYFICNKHPKHGKQKANIGHFYDRIDICKQCLLENISAENSHRWKGGISPLQQYLRKKIESWKIDSMRNCNYKCVITGQSFNNIHHLYGFNNIIIESINSLDLPIHNKINYYTNEELQNIEDVCLELHYKYPLGVCLIEDIHKLFHKTYGTGDNTSEQFENFKTRLKLGDFNSFLEENKLNLVI